MKQRTRFHTRYAPYCAALALAFALLGACAQPRPSNETQPVPARRESPVVASTPDASAQPATPGATPAPEPRPPQPSEARAALERIYKGAVSFDERGGRIVTGDFNGDGSEDIAIAVRPAPGKMGELNDELSNWIVSDPHNVVPPDPRQFDPHQGVQKLQPEVVRPKVGANDALLVVIHGFKEEGWRNPEALQTYLLKNVAGAELKSQARVEAQAATRKRVHLFGDVIRETLSGESGFLYWTGASYGWLH
jgi:hypothetical protein